RQRDPDQTAQGRDRAEKLGNEIGQARGHGQGQGCARAQVGRHPASHVGRRNEVCRQRDISQAGNRITENGNKGFRVRRDTSLPEAKSLRRDDGRGQIVTGSVTATITRPQIGRPPPHLIPSGGGLAPTTDRRVTRRRDDATKGLTVRGPLQKSPYRRKVGRPVSSRAAPSAIRRSNSRRRARSLKFAI